MFKDEFDSICLEALNLRDANDGKHDIHGMYCGIVGWKWVFKKGRDHLNDRQTANVRFLIRCMRYYDIHKTRPNKTIEDKIAKKVNYFRK